MASLDVDGPSPRTFAAVVWDTARAEAVLFGGRRVLFGREGQKGTFLSDTWALGADGWRLRDQTGPPPRSEAGMAYDRARRVVVMFGGYNDGGGKITRLGDTWEWDGTAWHLRAETGPVPRSGVAMTYERACAASSSLVATGGLVQTRGLGTGVAGTTSVPPATQGRFNSLAQYDPVRRQIVRTTGWNGAERVRETWLFNGARWSLGSSEGPSARNHSAMAFDRRRGRLVLHGGHDGTLVFGDTCGNGTAAPNGKRPLNICPVLSPKPVRTRHCGLDDTFPIECAIAQETDSGVSSAQLALSRGWHASRRLFFFIQAPSVSPPSCAASEYRQFDFWIGEWVVHNPKGAQVGTSRIEQIENGCGILEQWTNARGDHRAEHQRVSPGQPNLASSMGRVGWCDACARRHVRRPKDDPHGRVPRAERASACRTV